MSLTLYYHPLASFCHKVLIALYERGIAFEPRLIDLSSPADAAELRAVWPFGKFPVIRDHAAQRDVAESTIIIEYLERYGAPASALMPSDTDAALDVRLWDRFYDNYVQAPMQQIVSDRMNGGKGDTIPLRATLDIAYAMLEHHLASRTWMSPYGFSMADCAAAPALFYAGIVHPFPPAYTQLSAYFDRLVQRTSVQRVIDEARPYFHFFPFIDAMPQRFRRG
ncbi:MAG: glutathione S-transferase family protein [Tahibacter sp.]